MKKEETNNKKRNLNIVPNGMKKTGNLKSIFSDGTKIFIKKDDKKTLLTEKKFNNLFWFQFNNWNKFMEQYIDVNRGQKAFKNYLNIYIQNDKFDLLKKGISNIKNTIVLELPDNQPLMKIMNQTKLELDKKKTNEKLN